MRYVIANSKGRRVASGRLGWQKVGTGHTTKWRPSARGVYTVTYRARDLAGNTEGRRATTVVTVR